MGDFGGRKKLKQNFHISHVYGKRIWLFC